MLRSFWFGSRACFWSLSGMVRRRFCGFSAPAGPGRLAPAPLFREASAFDPPKKQKGGKKQHMTPDKAFPFSLPYAPQFLILIPYAGPRNSRSAGPQFPIARHATPGSFLAGPGAAQFLIEIPIRISTTQFLIENPDFFVELYLGVLVDF